MKIFLMILNRQKKFSAIYGNISTNVTVLRILYGLLI